MNQPQRQQQEAMNVDQSPAHKVPYLQALTSSSISKLSASSRAFPSQKDFHFYYNFDEFKAPIQQIAKESQSMLGAIGSSSHIWGKQIAFPESGDLDDGYDWLVNVNDEAFERFDVSADEFQKVRKKEEETGVPVMESDDGFQLVYGKKKNRGVSHAGSVAASGAVAGRDESAVKVATRAKPKVPFHIPTIRKPQEEFNILVNNSNQPFDHVWLERSEDEQRFIHPLEKLSVLDFVDKDTGGVEPMKPPSLECTPFKLVEEVKDLKELAAKLRSVNEFAVDLEHNQYRSFQGLTCLMQISTRTEDFIVDTLKLRIHVGPYLREVFKDPAKKKVMHGADRDIIWLQRDFGIYVCNMFDTGQASRALKLERNSLEYLLHHFCGVTANKEYQNADWRLRPLPDEMVRYAREDTHYLLYIYDQMRVELLSMSKESENADSPLLEGSFWRTFGLKWHYRLTFGLQRHVLKVYKRSSDLCMQLYEKELLTENSFLYIYRLQTAGLNAQQLAVVAGLCEWRDVVARAEDESTGYILPNKTLIEIAKQMPCTTNKLRRLVKSKHSYIERNLASVVSIIRHSMANGAAFEAAAEHLRQAQLETVSEENTLVNDGFEVDLHDPSAQSRTDSIYDADAASGEIELDLGCSTIEQVKDRKGDSSVQPGENGQVKIDLGNSISELPSGALTSSVQSSDGSTNASLFHSSEATGVTVQVLKKPNRGFGALLGNAASKRKFDTDKKEKEEIKLEQIRSSVNLPFHSFLGREEQLKPLQEEPPRAVEILHPEEPSSVPLASTNVEEIIMLDGSSNTEDGKKDPQGSALELDKEDEPMSLSELSSSFQECFQSDKNRKTRAVEGSKGSGGFLQLKPFDYEAARKQVKIGDVEKSSGSGADGGARSRNDSGGRKKGSASRLEKDDVSSEFPQGRRRQAFPATGNRSATFR